jgi:outer membrane protein assembly factor BamB
MPRSFDMATEYGGSVEQVHQAFSDEQYWLARLADSGADDYSLDSLTSGDGAICVKTTQRLRSDRLPAVVTQFHRGDLILVREETWSPIRDEQATATIRLVITGAPATLSGSAVLAPAKSGSGSRLEFKATVEVRVPLVGGKIENFIGSQLADLLIAEQRFTTVWIAENA